MVYPNQEGASHHHSFYGNTSVNFASNLNNLANVGNSTCNGGIMNRSAYWHPTIINTINGAPVVPRKALFYYKAAKSVAPYVVPPPAGLRMLTGNSKAKTEADARSAYTCILPNGQGTAWYKSIPNCNVGEVLLMALDFPQCWDGKNLDSPNHKDHMAFQGSYGTNTHCPTTHPVLIPGITMTMDYPITYANQTKTWRLASDNYDKSMPSGYSSHADWVNGWNETFIAGIVKNCINKSLDCQAHLLGDGRMFDRM